MAHNSLMGVVSELQSMELSFLKILTEAAMKLASLTDASLFVLFETPDGRRFAGRRHLCDAFVHGQLAATDRDVEFEVDTNVSGLRERDGSGDVDDVFDSAEPYPVEIISEPSPSRKRCSVDPIASLVPWSAPKVMRRDVKSEPRDFHDDDGAEEFSLDPIDGENDAGVFGPPDDHDGSFDASSLNHNVHRRYTFPRTLPPSLSREDPPNPHANFASKVEAIKKIPGHKFEDANSDEFRLLVSSMYEFGRITAENYVERLKEVPDLPHRPFFTQEFEAWILQFVNVLPFGHVMIKKGNRESKRSLLAYMRKSAGDAFGIGIKKLLKRLYAAEERDHQHQRRMLTMGEGANDLEK